MTKDGTSTASLAPDKETVVREAIKLLAEQLMRSMSPGVRRNLAYAGVTWARDISVSVASEHKTESYGKCNVNCYNVTCVEKPVLVVHNPSDYEYHIHRLEKHLGENISKLVEERIRVLSPNYRKYSSIVRQLRSTPGLQISVVGHTTRVSLYGYHSYRRTVKHSGASYSIKGVIETMLYETEVISKGKTKSEETKRRRSVVLDSRIELINLIKKGGTYRIDLEGATKVEESNLRPMMEHHRAGQNEERRVEARIKTDEVESDMPVTVNTYNGTPLEEGKIESGNVVPITINEGDELIEECIKEAYEKATYKETMRSPRRYTMIIGDNSHLASMSDFADIREDLISVHDQLTTTGFIDYTINVSGRSRKINLCVRNLRLFLPATRNLIKDISDMLSVDQNICRSNLSSCIMDIY